MKKYLAGLICLALMATLVIKVPVSAASPKLSATKATMYVGDTLKLSVKGAKKVKWSTDKKKVATVTQKGVVKARAKGNARITAKAGTKKLVCKVTVKATKLELSQSSIKIGLANPKQSISAKLNDKSVKASTLNWSSKDEKIATVSKGVIEAKAAGRTTITATYKKVKASVTVEVVDDKPVELTGKGLEADRKTVIVSDDAESFPLKVYFDGEEVTTKLAWSTSDEEIIAFEEDEFSIGDAGTATLTATYQGQTISVSVTVTESPDDADDDEDDDSDDADVEDDDDEGSAEEIVDDSGDDSGDDEADESDPIDDGEGEGD